VLPTTQGLVIQNQDPHVSPKGADLIFGISLASSPLLLYPWPLILSDLMPYPSPKYPIPILELYLPLHGCASLLLCKWSEAKVGLHDAEIREKFLGQVIVDAGVDNNIITWNPVDWCCDTVLVTSL